MISDARACLLLAATLGIFMAVWFLSAMYAREAVKRDLSQRGCTVRHIWWQPFACWNVCWRGTPFRVVYQDEEDRLHKAYCCVYTALMDSPFGPRRVNWIKDASIAESVGES
jgi:hypothetical protein